MATLIDAKYKVQGKTVLYVPNEGSNLSIQQATRNKEYVQRLESKHLIQRFLDYKFRRYFVISFE